jgi:MinD-like ATPase involved in chromosome partitioning or flagellar assembly
MILKFKDFLSESISYADATDDVGSIQTIIDGKRDLAYLVLTSNKVLDPRTAIDALKLAIDNGLNLLPVKNRSEGVAFVVYKNDLKSAQALADLAAKKAGYLNDETPDEARFIGRALNYHPEDVEEYVTRRYDYRSTN